ncbi:hypothetical protein [Rosistilla oblonga]|uniref:Uncharacterized protein n=1 Tax=Rosistilla oblonga TaxID=2527990 RepID=A0A518IPZ5_9BACT|nr:hypothetical protein [Rosistilla oblonga]QDV55158.1 hypothetical protein Mal33_11270 [Rosistilla oblonga]
METSDLALNQRIAVKAHWLKGRIVWGTVERTFHSERYKGENDWMKKHGGLKDGTFLFKPDNDGHHRLVQLSDVV